MNTDDYWSKFTQTGDIADYLMYSGMEKCEQAWDSDKNEQEKKEQTGVDLSEWISDGNWYGVVRNTHR